MKASKDHTVPEPASLRKLILDRRGAFGTYNVARLSELIRRLPGKRRKAFETVPILLHLNSKGLPGYVDHPRTPHGIYRFYESGFWKIGRKRLGIEEATTTTFLLKKYYLRGIYLAGSAGTHGQTGISDLNYWILIEPDSVDDKQRKLLSQKLEGIREWARENHGQTLTFLVLDHDQMRRNDFSALEEPYVALPHGSLVKEEFYRTFILIAGQIPFWAVLPDGLDDEAYACWTGEVRRLSDPDFTVEDYVDLGPVTSVLRGECLAGLLMEICRFREDPVRSLIKASLVAHHCFYQEQQGLLCDGVKQAFSTPKLGGESPDPAVYGFERAVRFYESIDDSEGFDLIKRCVYLRLSGYPGPPPSEEEDPSRDVLDRFRRQWAWSSDLGRRIEGYADWTEAERVGLEDRLLHRLRFLFNLLAQAQEAQEGEGGIGRGDLDRWGKRVEALFASKPDQIPHASAYLRAKRNSLTLRVEAEKNPAGGDYWAVYDQRNPASRKDPLPFFADLRLLRVLGWIVLNGMYDPERSSILFPNVQSTIVARRAEAFLPDLQQSFHMQASAKDLRSDPAWMRLLVVLDMGLGRKEHDLSSADFLIQNTWGELFHSSLDLGQVENNLLRCYEIAHRVWEYHGQATAGGLEYRIHHSRTIEGTQAAKNIDELIESMRSDDSGKPVP